MLSTKVVRSPVLHLRLLVAKWSPKPQEIVRFYWDVQSIDNKAKVLFNECRKLPSILTRSIRLGVRTAAFRAVNKRSNRLWSTSRSSSIGRASDFQSEGCRFETGFLLKCRSVARGYMPAYRETEL